MSVDENPPRLYRLILKVRNGGALVSATACSLEELEQAKAEDRFTEDSDGFGYVWRREAWQAP